MKLKPKLLLIHRWVGLWIGALLFVQSLTGVLICFRDEIELAIHPSLIISQSGSRQPVQTLLDASRAEFPAYYVSRLEFPHDDHTAVRAQLRRRNDNSLLMVALDPYSANIVREGALASWPMELLFRLHFELLAGKPGRNIVGITGIGLLFLVVTGPIIWWPGAQRLGKGLTVTLTSGLQRAMRELHRSAGAIFAISILILVSTGILVIWKSQLRTFLDWVGPYAAKPTPEVAQMLSPSLLPVDDLIDQAQRDYGRSRLQQLRFAGDDGRIVIVFLDSEKSSRPNASKQIWYDAHNGEKLGHYLMGETPAANIFIDWLLPIHTGKYLGIFGRFIVFLTGICVGGLTLSGAWMWWTRTSAMKRRRKLKAQAR